MSRALLVVALFAGTAAAEPPAAAAFAAGKTAYERGDYATAIVAFEAAFRADPRAEVAFTLAQAHRNHYFVNRDITHLQRALGLYRHYLVEAPRGRRAAHARMHLETIETILASLPVAPAPAAAEKQPTQLLVTADAPGARASVDGGELAPVPRVLEVTAGTHRIRLEAPGHDAAELDALAVAERLVVVPATLKPRPARIVVRTEGSPQIRIDGQPAASTTELAAGTHRLTVVARGREPVERELDLAAGTTSFVDVVLVPTPRRRAARWTLYSAAGLGGTAVIAGGLAWIAQRRAVSIYEQRTLPAHIDDYHEAVARRDAWRTVSIGLAATAGVGAIVGAALWYFDVPQPTERGPSLAPLTGPESVGAAVVGRF